MEAEPIETADGDPPGPETGGEWGDILGEAFEVELVGFRDMDLGDVGGGKWACLVSSVGGGWGGGAEVGRWVGVSVEVPEGGVMIVKFESFDFKELHSLPFDLGFGTVLMSLSITSGSPSTFTPFQSMRTTRITLFRLFFISSGDRTGVDADPASARFAGPAVATGTAAGSGS